MNVVVVSGDKDFQQLVRPGVWLLNPGRGGPASVEEQWVGVENGSERLGVPPALVTDYLALVGDTSDNVPGVKGIGEKTAQELVNSYGTVENILAHAAELTKKRPREALLEQRDMALLSKELVTIREDLPVTLDLDAMRLSPPDYARLRTLYVELEFHTRSRRAPRSPPRNGGQSATPAARRTGAAARDELHDRRIRSRRSRTPSRARAARRTSRSTSRPSSIRQRRTTSIRCARRSSASRSPSRPGEAYYFPLAHRERADDTQGDLELSATSCALEPGRRRKPRAKKASEPTSIAARALAARRAARSRIFRRSTARRWRRSRRCSRIRPSRRRRRTRSTTSLVAARRRRHAARSRLRHDGRELRARSRPPLARARSARARVPRSHDDDLRGSLRQGKGRSSRSTRSRSNARATTRARTPT